MRYSRCLDMLHNEPISKFGAKCPSGMIFPFERRAPRWARATLIAAWIVGFPGSVAWAAPSSHQTTRSITVDEQKTKGSHSSVGKEHERSLASSSLKRRESELRRAEELTSSYKRLKEKQRYEEATLLAERACSIL